MNFRVDAMRDARISERDRRTLVVGGVVVLAVLLMFRGIPAWRAWVHDTRASADALAARLALARQAAPWPQGAKQRVDSIGRAALALAPALLDGDTPAQAAATLASYVSETATAANVQLGGVQLAIDSAVGHSEVYRVRVHADGTGDVHGLVTFLQLLESGGMPLLAVRGFSISQSDLTAPPNRPEILRASFEIEGLAHRTAEP